MIDGSLVRKSSPGKNLRRLRLLGSVLDPRAWLHLVKIMNYYNYSHVTPLRSVRFAGVRNVSPDTVFQNGDRIEIGHRVRIGSRCHIWAGPSRGRIIIGDDVLFGPEVMITAATYRYELGHPVTDQPMSEADIEIGNDVWLATRVVILPGTRIGHGSVIAAGSVVKGDFPPMCVIAGSPGKVVGFRVLQSSQSK